MQKGVSLLSFVIIVGIIIIAIMEGFAILVKYKGVSISSYKKATSSVEISSSTPWYIPIKSKTQNQLDKIKNLFKRKPKKIEWAIEQSNCPSGAWHILSQDKNTMNCEAAYIHDEHKDRYIPPQLKNNMWQIYLYDICEDELRQHARGFCIIK